MNNTDHKLDAILRCLNFYYSKYNYSNEIYRFTGDKADLTNQFVSDDLISAWLDFTENETVNINRSELTDLLKHLETEKLVVSQIVDGNQTFKIFPEGISLIEKKGYVKEHSRLQSEYKMKKITIGISITAFLISLATFIYTVFIKK